MREKPQNNNPRELGGITYYPPDDNTIKSVLTRRDGEKKFADAMNGLFGIYILVAIIFFLNTFVLINARIPSGSMEPTIEPGDLLIGNRLSYIRQDPSYNDIIIFTDPDDPSRYLIKRVVALPGDVIDIRDGNVYLNGQDTPEDDSFCMMPQSTWRGGLQCPFTVPENAYFVLGDNRENSNDARFWDTQYVPVENIIGKAVFRYWPVWEIGTIR